MTTSDLRRLKENTKRAEKEKDVEALAAIAGTLLGILEKREHEKCQGQCNCKKGENKDDNLSEKCRGC